MFKNPFRVVVVLAFFAINCTTAVAAENQQIWSVNIEGDTAVLRTAPHSNMKLVCSTLEGLQAAGIDKLTLSSKAPVQLLKEMKTSCIICIENGLAQVKVSDDFPNKYVASITKALNSSGIHFVNISKANR